MKKRLSISILSAAFSLALSMPVFAGGWRQGDAGRWWYEKDTASETVYMNSWQKDSTGAWRFAATPDDNEYCKDGWWWIFDSSVQKMKCYYFDAQGYMLSNVVTPDGHQVNENGEWVKDGNIQMIYAPAPVPAIKEGFDYTQYLPGNYESNAAFRLQNNGWQKNDSGWWYQTGGNQWCANGWWWIFDASVQGLKGYYFDAQGYMLSNTVTPDGYQVNEYGERTIGGKAQVILSPVACDNISNDELEAFLPSMQAEEERRQYEDEEEFWDEEDEEDEEELRDDEDEEEIQDDEDEDIRDNEDTEQDVVQSETAAVEKFIQEADWRYPSLYFEAEYDGEDIILSSVGSESLDDDIIREKNSVEVIYESWDIIKSRYEEAAETLDQMYRSAQLKGTLTVNLCAGAKEEIRLSYENGVCVYDAVEDPDFGPDIETAMAQFEKEAKRFLRDTNYSSEDYKIEKDGEDVSVYILDVISSGNMRYDLHYTVTDPSTGEWDPIRRECEDISARLYKIYQTQGLTGSFTVWVCEQSESSVYLKYEDGSCTYDAEEELEEFRQDAEPIFEAADRECIVSISPTTEGIELSVWADPDLPELIYDECVKTLYKKYQKTKFEGPFGGRLAIVFRHGSSYDSGFLFYLNGEQV